ncbi:MAG: hypothetical protein NVS3B3_00240 [Aquirhabdus sp.]
MVKIFVLIATCMWLSSCAVYTPAGTVVLDPGYPYGYGHEGHRHHHHGDDDDDD